MSVQYVSDTQAVRVDLSIGQYRELVAILERLQRSLRARINAFKGRGDVQRMELSRYELETAKAVLEALRVGHPATGAGAS